jgi:bacterioferritin
MKGDAAVIKVLGEVLTAELTAINQYFVHSEMCENWKYAALAGRIKREAIDEMKHAEKLIERILYLDAVPNVQRYFPIKIGKDVKGMMESDVRVEYDAVERLNKGIAVCEAKGDAGSRELLTGILKDEEEHVDWLEAQLEQIRQMGIENYLATTAIKEDKAG